MMTPISAPQPSVDERDYLRVGAFLGSVVGAHALATAFQLGLIDSLTEGRAAAAASLAAGLGLDAKGLRLLRNLLVAHHVIEEDAEGIRLTGPFVESLKYRDLLEAQLEFAQAALPDFMQLLPVLVTNPGDFQRRSRLFSLFDYTRSVERSTENLAHTRYWVRLTTALTRYEAPVCMRYHDFGRHHRMLDVGGNSGEFALQVCRKHPGLRAAVLDLPVVCDVGREHVGSEPEAGRITFCEGDALADPWPDGCDLVTFKSMLHDWPEREAQRLLAKAAGCLAPGGTVLIFERAPIASGSGAGSYGLIPFLLFAHCFRPPDWYADQLRPLGFQGVAAHRIDLETPFSLVTGVRHG
ncbi:MAG TPA: methyltransferase [Candidatus Acidoferrum sp.]|nr:methyltransferase [Candidatus Acidoferrum sp.]